MKISAAGVGILAILVLCLIAYSVLTLFDSFSLTFFDFVVVIFIGIFSYGLSISHNDKQPLAPSTDSQPKTNNLPSEL